MKTVPFPVACPCWNGARLPGVVALGPETDATWPELSRSSNRCPLGHHPRCEFYVGSPLEPQMLGSQEELHLALAKLAHAYHVLAYAVRAGEFDYFSITVPVITGVDHEHGIITAEPRRLTESLPNADLGERMERLIAAEEAADPEKLYQGEKLGQDRPDASKPDVPER